MCRSPMYVDKQTDTAERVEGLVQTDDVEAPDADAPSRAELPSHLQDNDGSDAHNIVFAAKVVLQSFRQESIGTPKHCLWTHVSMCIFPAKQTHRDAYLAKACCRYVCRYLGFSAV